MRQLFSIFHFPFSVLVLFSFFPVSMEAQSDPYFFKAWIETGGTSPSANFLNHFCSTTDGSGKTYSAVSVLNSSNTRSTQVTVRLSSGTVSWTQTFTLDATGDTYAGGITVDASGNVYLTGAAWNGSTNFYDLYLRKYNSSGTYQWQQTFNGTGSIYDGGAAVGCSSAGDVYVAGGTMQSLTDMDLLVRKYNSSGTLQWGKTWNNAGLIDAGTGLLISDGGITVAGVTQKSAAVWEYATVQYKPSDGTLLNSSVTNLGGTSIERITAGVQDAAGNYYLTGAMGASGQGLNIKTIKFDAGLNIVWTATYNGSSNHDDSGRGLAVDGSGNVYVAGYTKSTDKQAILLKYNSSGQQQWAKIADPEAGDDEFAGVGFTSDNKLFAAGYQSRKGNRDIYAGMFDPSNGDVLWSDWYNGINNKNDEIANIIPDGSGNFTVSGWTDGTAPGGGKVIDIKYQRHTLVQPSSEKVYEAFTGNRGQLLNTDGDPEPSIRYYSRSTYPNTYLTDSRVSYVFSHLDTIPSSDDTLTRIDLTFPNSSNTRPPLAAGLEEQDWHYNYYLPHIPDGRERVPSVNKVLFADIYTNTDAIFGHGQDGLFIRLICKPGSNPSDVKLRFSGQTSLSILSNGSLKAETMLEDLIIPAPTALFIAANGTETAASWTPAFTIGSNGDVSVSTGSVPSGSTLVIKSGKGREEEEENYWSTYYGGSQDDYAIAFDTDNQNGDIYFTGQTHSFDFPVFNAIQAQISGQRDIVTGRFNYQGISRWVTFIGGSNAASSPPNSDENESGMDIAVGSGSSDFAPDGSGSVYVVGTAATTDFPLQNGNGGYFDDELPIGADEPVTRGVILKHDKGTGEIKWATFFGAKNVSLPREYITSVVINNDGNLIVGGVMYDGNSGWAGFPTTPSSPVSNGAYSQNFGTSFVAEFDSDNSLVWATQLTCNGPANTLNDIAVDDDNNIYVAGSTSVIGAECSNFFPLVAPSGAFQQTSSTTTDGWLMKFNSQRSVIWSTFLGGSSGVLGGSASDFISSLYCDGDDNLFVSGSTKCTDFPTLNQGGTGVLFNGVITGGSDVFLGKFSSTGVQLHTTIVGGSNDELFENAATFFEPHDGGCIAGDKAGNVMFAFTTRSPDLPFNNSYNSIFFHPEINKGANSSNSDGFFIITDNNFVVKFWSYWGGLADDRIKDTAFGSNNDQSYFIVGGWSKSKSPEWELRIPLAQETPQTYFQPQLGGDTFDGFISKIRLDQIVSSVKSEPDYFKTLNLSPNPSNSWTALRFTDFDLSDLVNVSIFDMTGHKIEITLIQGYNGEFLLDMSSLPSGVYTVSALTADGVISGLLSVIK